jgi:2',3'-cyclic-nucleotide 2'-phosphodiesterase (5'-nucleotidase family)
MSFLFFCLTAFLSSSAGYASELSLFTFHDMEESSLEFLGPDGWGSLMGILEKERRGAIHHLTVVTGDFLFPFVLSEFDGGRHVVELFQKMGVDIAVLGNHEFDYGPEILKKRMKESKFRWLSANVVDKGGGYFCHHSQSFIYDCEGVKVGFFGLTTPKTEQISHSGKEVFFLPVNFVAKRECEKLKSLGAQVIIALTHQSTEEDAALAKEVKDIHLIIGGHDQSLTWMEGDTVIYKPASGVMLGRVDLIFDKKMKGDEVEVTVYPSWRSLFVKGERPHEEALSLLKEKEERCVGLCKEIGEVGEKFDSFKENLKTGESGFGNFVADCMRKKSGAEIAIISGGAICGNHLYEKGQVLFEKDFYREFLFNSHMVVLEMKGKEIFSSMEEIFSFVKSSGCFYPQISGMEIVLDDQKEKGHKVAEIWINKKRLEKERIYTIATIDFIASGGEGYHRFSQAKIHPKSVHDKIVDLVITEICEKKKIFPKAEGRILEKSAYSAGLGALGELGSVGTVEGRASGSSKDPLPGLD